MNNKKHSVPDRHITSATITANRVFSYPSASPEQSRRTVSIIAHRGASFSAPENTLASVNLAWNLGADMVEVDVHLSDDDRILVIHDPSTLRTVGEDYEVGKTSSDALRKLDAGEWKAPEFSGEKIPFLEEVIETIPVERGLFMEIKCCSYILPFLKNIINESGKSSQLSIIGFNHDILGLCKTHIPDIPVYWLRDTTPKIRKLRFVHHDTELIDIAQNSGFDGLDIEYHSITQRFADMIKSTGLRLYAWTVDDPDDAKRLINMGIDGITTNRPGWLREQLRL